jgi:hypothetical protein
LDDERPEEIKRSETLQRRVEAYIEQGLVPIPVAPRDKKPLIKWDRYQDEPPKPGAVDEWFRTYPNANVGLICGPASKGFIALDIDDEATYQKLEAITERIKQKILGGQPPPNTS